jgi:hypothetical protein
VKIPIVLHNDGADGSRQVPVAKASFDIIYDSTAMKLKKFQASPKPIRQNSRSIPKTTGFPLEMTRKLALQANI